MHKQTWSMVVRKLPLVLIGSMLCACADLEAMINPVPPGSPNLVFEDGRVWQQVVPLNVNGQWLDSTGSRVEVTDGSPRKRVRMQDEDARFLWTTGRMAVQGVRIKLERRLDGDKIDTIVGRLGIEGDKGLGRLTIDFFEHGKWYRDEPLVIESQWIEGEASILVLDAKATESFHELNLQGNDPLPWFRARVTIRGSKASVVLNPGSQETYSDATFKIGKSPMPETFKEAYPGLAGNGGGTR